MEQIFKELNKLKILQLILNNMENIQRIKTQKGAQIPKGAKIINSEILELDNKTLLIYELEIEKRYPDGTYVQITDKNNNKTFGIIRKHGYNITIFHIILDNEKYNLDVTLMNLEIKLEKCSEKQVEILNCAIYSHGLCFDGKIYKL